MNDIDGSTRIISCNYERHRVCPLGSDYKHKHIVLRLKITSGNRDYFYTGACLCYIKQRIANQLNSFRNRDKMNTTSLSKLIWALNHNNKVFLIAWGNY